MTKNIQLENSKIDHVPTESANGAGFLHIKIPINHKLRLDLMIHKKGTGVYFYWINSKGLQNYLE